MGAPTPGSIFTEHMRSWAIRGPMKLCKKRGSCFPTSGDSKTRPKSTPSRAIRMHPDANGTWKVTGGRAAPEGAQVVTRADHGRYEASRLFANILLTP